MESHWKVLLMTEFWDFPGGYLSAPFSWPHGNEGHFLSLQPSTWSRDLLWRMGWCWIYWKQGLKCSWTFMSLFFTIRRTCLQWPVSQRGWETHTGGLDPIYSLQPKSAWISRHSASLQTHEEMCLCPCCAVLSFKVNCYAELLWK